jgi:hypothetical protein
MTAPEGFDPTPFMPRLPRAIERERALVEHVRQELGKRGVFGLHRGRLIFRTDRRVIAVNLRPETDFGRLVARVVGVSLRQPMVKRAVEVVVAEAREILS